MSNRLNVVLCWHMHQPYYRDGTDGDYRLPWVYLHGIKDYSDMAAHLERHPSMRAVVNFAPVLLEQLDDYAHQLSRLLENGIPTRDGFLNLLAGITAIPADSQARMQLVRDCMRAHAPRMIHPYPVFSNLLHLLGMTDNADVAATGTETLVRYLSDQYFLDLLMWYHLAWLGQSLRDEPAVQALFERAAGFTEQDRHQLLVVMRDCLVGLIPRYRQLADRQQIELSMTPYGHPIIPLMYSFDAMNCAMPDAPHPHASGYPGGAERSHWHVQHGIEVFERFFGRKPQGVWLAEGGISEAAVELLDEFSIRWTASGEGVWRNSCRRSALPEDVVQSRRLLFAPWQHPDSSTRLFFRDDGLSDLIGFRYSNWHADDAVADFMQHLYNIAAFLGDASTTQVVPIILDGENAWEYYPNNGHDFLDGLYRALSESPRIRMMTFAEAAQALPSQTMPNLCEGSWVYGSFSTWIGSADKNRGWDYLVAAKQAFDETMLSGNLDDEQQQAAVQQLAICEGSDWFWWFGDYNPATSVSDFERLFREQLRHLYQLLGKTAPVHLDVPLSHGGGFAENAGTMRRNVE